MYTLPQKKIKLKRKQNVGLPQTCRIIAFLEWGLKIIVYVIEIFKKFHRQQRKESPSEGT